MGSLWLMNDAFQILHIYQKLMLKWLFSALIIQILIKRFEKMIYWVIRVDFRKNRML